MTYQDLRNDCEPMLLKAEAEGMWLYASYHQIWFTPTELRGLQANDKFCWSPENFEPRDPDLFLEMHERKFAVATVERDKARARYNAWKAES